MTYISCRLSLDSSTVIGMLTRNGAGKTLLGPLLGEDDAVIGLEPLLDEIELVHGVGEHATAPVVQLGPRADENDVHVGLRVVEDPVDRGARVHGVLGGHLGDDLDQRHFPDAVVGLATVAGDRHALREMDVVVPGDFGRVILNRAAAHVPADGVVCGDEDGAGLPELVGDLGVLAEVQARVLAERAVVDGAGHGRARAHVRRVVASVRRVQVVGVAVDLLRPVLVQVAAVVVIADRAGLDLLVDLFGRVGPVLDEALLADRGGLGDEVPPLGVLAHVVAEEDHVGVAPVDDVARGRLDADVGRVRAAPAVAHLVDADDARVLRHELAELDRLFAAAIVEHDDLEQVLGVVLCRERRERELERLALERRDDDGDRERRLPALGQCAVEDVSPAVAGDNRGRGGLRIGGSHVPQSSQRVLTGL